MMSYPHGMILDNASNYGILKTETYIGFSPPTSKNFADQVNGTDQVKWVLTPVNLEKSSEIETSRSLTKRSTKKTAVSKSGAKVGRSKIHKCIFKIFKKGDNGNRDHSSNDHSSSSSKNRRRRRRRRHGIKKIGKKIMMPLILGLLAAKSVLIPIALKALAFLSTKGLVMGFFSTVLASVISLKGMFDNKSHYDRKDEKTQVEVIQIPTKHDEHYYTEDGYPYKRLDVIPIQTPQIVPM